MLALGPEVSDGEHLCFLSTMPTDTEPSILVKVLHLIFLSTFWGMQIWVTFVSGTLHLVLIHSHALRLLGDPHLK